MTKIKVGVNSGDKLGSGANKTVYGVEENLQGPFSIEKNDDDDDFLKNYAIANMLLDSMLIYIKQLYEYIIINRP